MNTTDELWGLLGQWRQLSEREREAILNEDWEALARHQAGKSQLTAPISEALNRLRAQSAAGELEHRINACGSELIAWEQRNQELLQAKRLGQTAERAQLSETSRHLQGVRRAYGGGTRSLWQSYS